ncbi:PfkB family carbohydrate kinase [Calidifontibacter terrae]
MTANRRVIHTGQALVDLVTEVPNLPSRGGNVMATAEQRYAGGAVNILVAAARTGAAAVLAGAHGTGPNGDLIRSALQDEGVTVSADPVQNEDTAICVVLVEPSAERTFVTAAGAERRISPESLQTSDPQPGDLVCVSGYALLGPTREPLLTWLDSLPSGVDVVLDPGAVFAALTPDLRDHVLRLTTVWTSNAEEATGLSGVIDPRAACGAVAALLPPGAVSIVRDGPLGCWVHADGSTSYVAGFPQEPVDTNGAGDAHTGVLCGEIVAGTDWIVAARRANAGGAIKVTRRGPATAPTRAEVDEFLAQQGGTRSL